MRKANWTAWIAMLCLAAAAAPAKAQQSPSILTKVRSLLGQSPAPKPAPKPAPAPNSAAKPLPAAASAPVPTPAVNSAANPAATPAKPTYGPPAPVSGKPVPTNASAKPGENLPVRALSTGIPTPKPTPVNNPVKPASPEASKLMPGAANAKPSAAVNADIPKAVAIPTPAVEPVKENIARRDPFSPLIAKQAGGGGGAPQNLPPGKPGLMIGTLHIDGIVSGPSGMIAIVSNAQERVYFLREGDHLYDGQVEHITMDGISFHQSGKDPFGNAVEREVAKRLNPTTPGEEQ